MRQESLQVEPGLKWYAIRTKPNREKEVEKRLSALNLAVFLPWMRTRRRIGTRFYWVLVPLFPVISFVGWILLFRERRRVIHRESKISLPSVIGLPRSEATLFKVCGNDVRMESHRSNRSLRSPAIQ